MPKSRSSKKQSKTTTQPTSRSPSPSPSASTTTANTTNTTATKRLLHELSENNNSPNPALLHLGPTSDENLLEWEAVLKGPPANPPDSTNNSNNSNNSNNNNNNNNTSTSNTATTTRSPYTNGLWLLTITIPETYPHRPPRITFATPICHPNISLTTGEICLSLLTTEHWSPMYTISSTLGAVQQLLSDPVNESPLNVDIANLYRDRDLVGAQSLVRYWTVEMRWRGEGKGGWISRAADGGLGA